MDAILKDVKLKIAGHKKSDDAIITRLKRLISTGNAIIFVGAGFSKDSKNILGNDIPLATDLALKISDQAAKYLEGIDSDPEVISEVRMCDDLMVASDFYLNNIPRKEDLLKLLKDYFTIQEVTQEQIDIFSMKWRRIYTTNYDNAIELSLNKASKSVTPLTLEDIPSEYKFTEDICLHINGRVERSRVDDLDSAIKLTTSSYLSPEQFITSNWYRQFKTDIENSSAIIFLGYSMYDIDIQKIFFNNKEIKDKTFFITREGSTKFQNYKLGMFGETLNIGVNGFSEIAKECINDSHKNDGEVFINSMDLFSIEDEDYDIRDSDISKFMVLGIVNDSYINEVTRKNNETSKIIIREEVDRIIEHIKDSYDILITSDLGNGKSVITKILMSKLTRLGYSCYYHLFNDFNFSQDIDALSQLNKKIVIFIDDYNNCVEDVSYLIENCPSNIQIVLTTRHFGYEKTKQQLLSIDMKNFMSHNIDELSDAEVDNFIDIVDNLGEWGEKSGVSRNEKLADLDESARHQLSFLLLTILKSESIKLKIKEITDVALTDKKYKDTIFAILILDIIGLKLSKPLISDVATNNEIFNSGFSENDGVRNLFNISNGMIKTKSSTLSRFLVAYMLDKKYVVNQMLVVIEHVYKINVTARDHNLSELIKSLLRFSIVEKLLPQKRHEINYFYEKVKGIIPSLMYDPHFWVQYAMSMIPFKDYPSAEKYLTTAYSLALRRDDYHTRNIDTQRARLHLLVSLTKEGHEAFNEFKAGDDLIKLIPNDIYKYRQISRYRDVYEKIYPTFNNKQKVDYEHAVKRIIRESKSQDLIDDVTYKIGVNWLNKLRDNLGRIITLIEEDRVLAKKV
ncbi:SIR2 family protein [Morganella morganii]|uniref:SIR2 family protein n=1 Tax=Morganella morganii TaxID=582 RepID=UPI003D080714